MPEAAQFAGRRRGRRRRIESGAAGTIRSKVRVHTPGNEGRQHVDAGSGDPDIVADGELTIKGITHPVALTVEVNDFGPDPYGGTRVGLSATGEINRTDYGITANMTLPTGGVMVSEKIQLVIEVEAALKTE
jgi:hypothetical protein